MAPANTARLGAVIDRMTATKKVLSPISEQMTAIADATADCP